MTALGRELAPLRQNVLPHATALLRRHALPDFFAVEHLLPLLGREPVPVLQAADYLLTLARRKILQEAAALLRRHLVEALNLARRARAAFLLPGTETLSATLLSGTLLALILWASLRRPLLCDALAVTLLLRGIRRAALREQTCAQRRSLRRGMPRLQDDSVRAHLLRARLGCGHRD